MTTILRGLTWDHPRATRPLVAATSLLAEQFPSVEIEWDVQSLSGFEDAPIALAAHNYDLVVFDHPHVGEIVSGGLFVPFDEALKSSGLTDADFIGPSLASYEMNGHYWGVPLDAAAQVACYRSDLLDRLAVPLPNKWEDVLALGEAAGRSGLKLVAALNATHALMTFLTLNANLGSPLGAEAGQAFKPSIAATALAALRAFVKLAEPLSLAWDSIQVQNAMRDRDDLVYCPLVYGFAPYALNTCHRPLTYGDFPGLAPQSQRGSTIGGAGLGVSSMRSEGQLASQVAIALVKPQIQVDAIARNGGQPAHRRGWTDPDIDCAHGGFFFRTYRTLEEAWVRPRFDGYMTFQRSAGQIVLSALRDHSLSSEGIIGALQKAWQAASARL